MADINEKSMSIQSAGPKQSDDEKISSIGLESETLEQGNSEVRNSRPTRVIKLTHTRLSKRAPNVDFPLVMHR